MKRLTSLLLALLLLIALPLALSSCGGRPRVAIEVRGFGTIVVELDPSAAPKTVENFKKLVAEGFYDGSCFHRVIEGFMIQGGQSATGERADTIVGEFASNGHNNSLKHERGVISMARATDPDSASSEFFIMHEDAPHLDGEYAAFGRVVEGMEVVDAIAEIPTYYKSYYYQSYPTTDVVIESITFVEE